MRSALNLLLAVMLMLTASCDFIKNYDRPHLELSTQAPYRLDITKFTWGYGLVGFNQFSGDFDKLDEKVYNLLKDKSGTCKVYMEQGDEDKYGNINTTMNYIGDINIDELNNYKDWQYWQKDGGVRKLLYNTKVSQQPKMADSAKQVTVDTTIHSSSALNQSSYTPTRISRKVYDFSENMLYPLEGDRNDLDSNRFVINGEIASVNFDSGVMQIQTQDELLDIQYYPLDASSEVASQLRLALETGNHIKSLCARAGASTLDLVSCKITSITETSVHRDTLKKM